MNLKKIFALYSDKEPETYEIKDKSRGEDDYRLIVLTRWKESRSVIKISGNDFTTPERVLSWKRTADAYRQAGYYCPDMIRGKNGEYVQTVSFEGRQVTVYAEEYSKYQTAEQFEECEIKEDGSYTFRDSVYGTIGTIGQMHLKTADFPSGLCILEKFSESDECDEVMEEALNFKNTVEKFLPQYAEQFKRIWGLFLENKKKLEEIYGFLPTSVFQGDLNSTNVLLDEKKQFAGLIDFNLSGRDSILNQLMREFVMEYDDWGNEIFYSERANNWCSEELCRLLKETAGKYDFSEAERKYAILVYRYVRPFWWRPAHEIERVKEEQEKVRMIFEWVEHELKRTDIDFAGCMQRQLSVNKKN